MKKTTPGEGLNCFGDSSRFEFFKRTDLWPTAHASKFNPASAFGSRTGMTRHRFDDLCRCVALSDQNSDLGATTSVQHCWELVNDFVKSINVHRETFFNPRELICVEESVSCWHDLGGSLE